MTAPPSEETQLTLEELREAWPVLSSEEQMEAFSLLNHSTAQEFFLTLTSHDRATVIMNLPVAERRLWLRLLPPDDAADVIQESPDEMRQHLLELLDEPTRKEVNALLSYRHDVAGGLMNPRFARLRPNLTVDEAIRYLRLQTRETVESIFYVYVLDDDQRLLGVVSFQDLFRAPSEKQVKEIMKRDVVTIREDEDREVVASLFTQHKYFILPVVDHQYRLKGIITADDILHAVQKEATEDIQKIGGTEALNQPYLKIGLLTMLKKRAGWLAALFLGEMLTASAMSKFEHEIAQAVVLALFVPLIISSGGNSGSQASTLVIRAMALGEVRLRDWWLIIRRELLMGFGLGLILATIGLSRILLWQFFFHMYGEHYFLVASSVALSLVGVVMWGTLAGSMLPFILRRFGFDPASASAPFVATLVDVSGIIIYFTVSAIILHGTLL